MTKNPTTIIVRRSVAAVLSLTALTAMTACGDDDGDTPPESSNDVASTSAAPGDGQEAAVFESPDGDYTVQFPDGLEPERNVESAEVPGGSVDVTFYIAETDERAYAVSTASLPNVSGTTEEALEAARDQAIAGVNGTEVDSTPIRVQQRPGVEYSAEVVSNGVSGTYVSQIFLDGKTLYQLIATGPGEVSTDDPDVASFFDSFTFTGTPG